MNRAASVIYSFCNASLRAHATAVPSSSSYCFTGVSSFLRAPSQFTPSRQQHCCPGLDRVPPEEINIEYDPADVDAFIAIADAVELAYPRILVNGNVNGDGRPGSFEVTTPDGAVIYTRLGGASRSLPQAQEVVTSITASTPTEGAACVLPGADTHT